MTRACRTTRRTAALTLTLALPLALTLSACSGDEAAAPDLLTQAEADQALLTLEDVGEGFEEVEPEDEDDADAGLGCLDAVELDEADADVEAEAQFDATNEFGLPSVLSSVASFSAQSTLEDALESFRSALEDCTSVDETDEDGTRFTLDVATDDTATDGVDEQLNLVATGTVFAGGLEVPFGFWVSVVRIGNDGAFVGYVDVESSSGQDRVAELLEVQVEKLAEVAG